ncbi:hypothetical protein HanPSC8_Chr06g0262381 [Helianthus annuus]|nr:hypothetical protein HanPSC8_Chr06g0262381 [Helianthus annuus]
MEDDSLLGYPDRGMVHMKCRNDMIFNNKQPNIIGVKEQIKHLGYIWIRNRAKAQVITWEQWCEFDLSCMSL